MKGYCDKKGFPLSIPATSTLEAHMIVDRFNSVIRGITNYYVNMISSTHHLNRWLYIIHYSCLKTLAQKYNSKISEIKRNFLFISKFQNPRGKIEVAFYAKVPDSAKADKSITLKKSWVLLDTTSVIKALKNGTYTEISKRLLLIDKWDISPFSQGKKGRTPRIYDMDFFKKANWSNLRTLASVDLPCALCGAQEDIEMHHVKSIRKSLYKDISEKATFSKIMSLRNSKQIPVCKCCHQNIHSGAYNGRPLKGIQSPPTSPTLYDNRIVNPYNYVVNGKPYKGAPLVETLTSRGWKKV